MSGPLIYQTSTVTTTPVATVYSTSTGFGTTMVGFFTATNIVTVTYSSMSIVHTTSTQVTTSTASSATTTVSSALTTSSVTSTVSVPPVPTEQTNLGSENGMAFVPIPVDQQKGYLFKPQGSMKGIAINQELFWVGCASTLVGLILFVRRK